MEAKQKKTFESMSNWKASWYKKTKVEASPEWFLPYDMALGCLARVSRSDHGALSMASKSCRSLVASSDLYKIRSLEGHTETYVYVCLRTPPPYPSARWYILRRRKSSSESDLIPIPSFPIQAQESSSVVVLDWGIYVIGGLVNGHRTSDVFLLDCRTHTWRLVPSMRVARANTASGVIDGKIYVLGGCKFDGDQSSRFGEVFDPKTETWDVLPWIPGLKYNHKYFEDSFVCDQKVYGVDATDQTLYYKPRKGRWGKGNHSDQGKVNRRDWCMIDNLLYCCCTPGAILWCEPEELHWRQPKPMHTKEVKGLDSLKTRLYSSRLRLELIDLVPGIRMSNSGGNIVLFWDVVQGNRLEIWCAEISLDKRKEKGEIWGNIEWSNAVMTVDPFIHRYKVLYSASVTL